LFITCNAWRQSVVFEGKFPIGTKHRRAPNLDVVVRYQGGAPVAVAAIECKFTEAYGKGR
jgi:hypothetical protein